MEIIKALYELMRRKTYIAYPAEYEDVTCGRVIVRAWSHGGARAKAYKFLEAENIVVREYDI